MTALLAELKIRARLRINALRRNAADGAGTDLRLRDCLTLVAREVGFAHWEHARVVLGGFAQAGADMGSFWHAPRTGSLLNEWFAHRDEARAALLRQPASFLLPYRRQFVVVQADFVRELGIDPAADAWTAIDHDLDRGYGTPSWQALAWDRLHAPRATFA